MDSSTIERQSADSAPWGAEVTETEVLGYPCLTFVNRRKHLSELLLDGRRFAERDYLIQGDRRMTFAEHELAVASIGALLEERGIAPGDRVLLFGANAIEWVVAFWAAQQVGAIVVLANAWWSGPEVNHAVATVEPALVIADDARAKLLPPELARLSFGEIAERLDSRQAASAASRAPSPEDDPAIVLFTSGTTGLPKGAVLSHRGILSTLQSLVLLTRRLPTPGVPGPSPSKSLLSLPLFHVGGVQQILTPMVAGGTLVFTEGRFDPARVVKLIEDEQISVWSTVPTMASRVMDFMESTGHQGLQSIRTVGLGGSPVGAQLRSRVPSWFPNAVRGVAVTYGLSEAGGVLATGVGKELSDRPGTVGRALKVVTLRIDEPDEDGCGEILARSPSVMLGYWPADGTSSSDDDGTITNDRWLRTGDIGRLDSDGYLYVTDRSKDIVIRGGENIATPHVENRLLEHPGVLEVAVVGLPHAELGEELGAIVVLAPDEDATAEELRAFAAAELAYFEVPTRWLLQHERLPQNATGKTLKREVRRQWIAQLEAVPGKTS